jgi:hypothetical protein
LLEVRVIDFLVRLAVRQLVARLVLVAQKAIAHPGIMADAAKVHPGAPGMLRAVANKPWIGGAAHMEQAGQVAQGTSVARQMAGQNKGLGY